MTRRARTLLWFAFLVALALVLATCTERRSPRPPRTFESDPPAAKPEPRPKPKPKHKSHEHAHGSHPHQRDAHHHHPHPHPHVEGASGHHHPF